MTARGGTGREGSRAADVRGRFLALSSALTGYTPAELEATGQVQRYYDTLTQILGGALVGELLSAWDAVLLEASGREDAVLAGLRSAVLPDPRLGPVARNLATLWYLGQWNQMPGAWRDAYGASARDLDHVVSAAAYREGLVWDAIGAHPMGAKQQGYGAWALPPEEASGV